MNQASRALRLSVLRSSAWPFGVMLFVTYAYFIAAPSWNENSRFALTRSLAERGRVDIDPYQHETGDKAFRNGHYYSDKAPGASLLAVPVYALYHLYLRATGNPAPASRLTPDDVGGPPPTPLQDDNVQFNLSFRRSLYLCNLGTNALAAALLGVAFLLALCRLGVPPRQSLFAGLVLTLGSLLMPYATMFYGHVLTAAFLFGSFALLAAPAPRTARPLRIAGLLAGLAVLTEFPAVVPAAFLFAYALRDSPRQDVHARLAHLLSGVAVPLLLLAAYQAAAFGSPLRLGYSLVSRPEFAQGMSQGVMGVGLPRLSVLGAELFGRARGLLYVAPVLLLGFVGLGRALVRSSPLRAEALLCSAMVLYFLLLNTGYYMWTGGSALGPRHLIPALPFLCVGVPFALPGFPRTAARIAAGGLLALSIFNEIIATAVAPAAPLVPDVLRDHVYLHFFAGDVAVAAGATNVGLILGLPGPFSLLPLALLWFLALRVLLSSFPPEADAR